MSAHTHTYGPQLNNGRPLDPDVLPIGEWLPANLDLYRDFRAWLRQDGYSESDVSIYSTAVGLALGWLDKPYWEIDPEEDQSSSRKASRTALCRSAGPRCRFWRPI